MVGQILDGVRILDFTWMLAGPYATRLLADFGAEVIKIQSEKTAQGAESNLTAYFNNWNRNKRSITLDLSHPEAKEIILRLVSISDAVVENFSPRVMSNWGLHYEELKKVKPNLIMVSLSAMGQTGPWKDLVAFGQTIQAFSGMTFLSSFSPDSPMGLGYAYADVISGLYAAMTVLAGLKYREETGEGQYIDLSEFEALCTLLGPTFMNPSIHHQEILPKGNRSDDWMAAPYGCYRCSGEDRWCVIAIFDESQWEAFCLVTGNPAWTKEERFSTIAKRKENSVELDELIGQWTIQRRAEEVVSLLQGKGIPSGIVQNAKDLAEDPQLMERQYFILLSHPVLGEIISDAQPIRFKNHSIAHWKAAPLLGQDNQYVFRELLGYSEKELFTYIERGIIH